MNEYIILLRGVNVGGNNLLPMNALKVLLESRGYQNVRTYIQSGNIVLQAEDNPENELGPLIQAEFGFTPKVLVLSESEFKLSVANNPYPEFEGKTVHFYFCKDAPVANFAKLEALATNEEHYELVGSVLYLHAPNGIGRSRLAAGVEACLGVPATGRNLNTINKLRELSKST